MLEAYHCLQTSLRRRRNLTSAAGMSNVEASRRSLGFGFWAPNGLNVVCFEFPLRWQIDNGFFNRPIIAGTQILLHRLRPVAYKDFGSSSQTDLVSTVAQATAIEPYLYRDSLSSTCLVVLH